MFLVYCLVAILVIAGIIVAFVKAPIMECEEEDYYNYSFYLKTAKALDEGKVVQMFFNDDDKCKEFIDNIDQHYPGLKERIIWSRDKDYQPNKLNEYALTTIQPDN